MKILIAPDKFKGSLSAAKVCVAIKKGIRNFDKKIETICHPLADGGEGSLDVLSCHLELKDVHLEVLNPNFKKVLSSYKVDQNKTAYIELAKASGLQLLAPENRNCFYTSTYGTGQLMGDAIWKGATKIYLFIGGSASHDCGIGLAHALGVYFYKGTDKLLLEPLGKNLINIVKIDPVNSRLKPDKTTLTVVHDVNNLLYGEKGAAYVYAAQKGADARQIDLLEKGTIHFARVLEKEFGRPIANLKGGGAAGGVGAGTAAIFKADLQPGTQTFIEMTNLKSRLKDVDLIIGGEGKLDSQTLHGKVISGLGALAMEMKIPFAVICGTAEITETEQNRLGIRRIKQLVDDDINLANAMWRVRKLLELRAFELMSGR